MAAESTPKRAGAPFPLLSVEANTSDWGPQTLPPNFEHIPYAPFNKSDRLGRCADFVGASRWSRPDRRGYSYEENEEFGYRHDSREEKSFHLVDSSKAPRRSTYRRVMRPRPFARRPEPVKTEQKKKHQGSSFNKRYEKLNRARWSDSSRRYRRDTPQREASVKVSTAWTVLEQYDMANLSKLVTKAPEAEDLKWCGRLDEYNESYDRCSTKNKKPVGAYAERDFFYESTMSDPVIQELASDDVATAYATDAVLSHIMAASRTVYPWDIVITYSAEMVFLDVREPLQFEMHTVSETAPKPPAENDGTINSRGELSVEATAINQAFTQQVLRRETGSSSTPAGRGAAALGVEMEANPFWDEESAAEGHTAASLAYRYRKWDLEDFSLVCRSTLQAVDLKREPKLLNIFALNEWDSKLSGGIEWRKSIDAHRGQLLATELRHNAGKMAKWTVQSVLSGADEMKIGFVSRVNRSNPSSHEVLGTQTLKPKEFAHQLSLNPGNMWGIVKWIVGLVRKHAKALQGDAPDDEYVAKFVLLKEPNKNILTFYQVPADSFEEEEEGEDGESKEWGAAGAGASAGAGAGAGAGAAAGGAM